jgi:ABC-type Mn2+/Zn2+ transport system ATPase subunit
MTMLVEILKWSETTLPLWQQDALRRLFQANGELGAPDLDDLYALLKQAHKVSVEDVPTPVPLAATHLPAALKPGETLVLKKIRELKHVNRLATKQQIEFSPDGLTVVYGGNGAGKSGYARVLKRACRSRDDGANVHPDATDPASVNHVPEATFDIEYNAVPKTVRWVATAPPPEELATIGVFDSHCARAYLTAEQDVAYLPYGLDIVENLANQVIPALGERLRSEAHAVNIDVSPFKHLISDTEVGRLVGTLGPKSDEARLRVLSVLTNGETDRLAQLDKALAEVDKKLKAKELNLSAGRIKSLIQNLVAAGAWVTDEAVAKLQKLDGEAEAARAAEKAAAESFRLAEDLLPGTGERAWELLFIAARQYSVDAAYPNDDFPYTGPNARCVLCQTPLTEAAARLNRFNEYLKTKVAAAADASRKKVDEARAKINRADLRVRLEDSLAGELDLLDGSASVAVRAWLTAVEERRQWMLSALDSHEWSIPPTLPENPRRQLRSLAAKQLKAARVFERASNEKARQLLVKEQAELAARKSLSSCADGVVELVQRMRKRSLLEACEKDLRTKPVTDASKKFAAQAVTSALKTALDREFASLGVGHIRTALKDRNERGKIKHRLLLDVPRGTRLDEVLSEGEQRAIALGSFLAELDLADHLAGIVFDDPVSSLDHNRRRLVAKRLARESKRRQVVVFTHDVVFLQQLIDSSEQVGSSPRLCFVENVAGYAGHVAAGLPWDHKSVADRIDKLEKSQKAFEKLPWPSYPDEDLARQMIRQYSFLRATIERAVQDLFLNGTVQRFRDYIEVKRLEQVVGLEESEVKELLRLNKRCHDIVEAHDPSSAKDEPPPTPAELHKDLEDLKLLISQVRLRRSKTNAT